MKYVQHNQRFPTSLGVASMPQAWKYVRGGARIPARQEVWGGCFGRGARGCVFWAKERGACVLGEEQGRRCLGE